MNRLSTALAATLFCFSAGIVHAQAPASDAGKGPGMMGQGGPRGMMMKPCSQEADPAKCEANRKQVRENMKAAHEACKDKPDRSGCMTEQFCAKSPDPAKCNERAKERHARMSKRMDQRQAAAEACTGKRGDALMSCMHEQRAKRGQPEPHDHDKKG
jgi:hypothetical protein